jgi:hypothetical protein
LATGRAIELMKNKKPDELFRRQSVSVVSMVAAITRFQKQSLLQRFPLGLMIFSGQ